MKVKLLKKVRNRFQIIHMPKGFSNFGETYGAHNLYCTFHQSGEYVLFSADKDIDYIVDVIEY